MSFFMGIHNACCNEKYQAAFLSQWVAMMLVAGQNYIDSSGSAIQCMQDKGNGKNTLVVTGIANMAAYLYYVMEMLLLWWEWFSGVPGKIMNNYCWIMSTYTLPRLWDVSYLHPYQLTRIFNCDNILWHQAPSVSEWMGSCNLTLVLTIIPIKISAGWDQYRLHPSWSWPSWRWYVARGCNHRSNTTMYWHSFAPAV